MYFNNDRFKIIFIVNLFLCLHCCLEEVFEYALSIWHCQNYKCHMFSPTLYAINIVFLFSSLSFKCVLRLYMSNTVFKHCGYSSEQNRQGSCTHGACILVRDENKCQEGKTRKEWWECFGLWRVVGVIAILTKLARKGVTKNITSEQNPERNEEMSHEDIWGRISQQVQRPQDESTSYIQGPVRRPEWLEWSKQRGKW